jgi:hypothetical protein
MTPANDNQQINVTVELPTLGVEAEATLPDKEEDDN